MIHMQKKVKMLNNYIIIENNCMEVLPTLSDNHFDLILTDLPYGTTQCSFDNVIPFDFMWEHLNRIIKKDCAIVLFGHEPFSSALRMSNIKNYRYDWYWNKKAFSNQMQVNTQPLRIIENIMVFNFPK